ncbi:MAG TPA: hypothetical protein VFC38_11530 [Stellaceae bacterium]|nr:hypothetical protein [Stellaceae bacterium]
MKQSIDARMITPPSGDFISDEEICRVIGEISGHGKPINIRTLHRWDTLREGPPITKMGKFRARRRDSFLAWLKARERSQVRT